MRLDYLQCNPKYRVTAESLAKVREMCKSSGLSPSQNMPKEILSGDAYDQLLSGNAALISASRPVMNRVFEHLADKTRLIFLCDFRGYIVDLASSNNSPRHLNLRSINVRNNCSSSRG